ncbi:caspase family protein [Chitinophaga ginsengisoli]|uniref:Putative Rossmann-fold nucleotide-binding protein n=1 Tax=Chitinophaga ginsengisoli TaxID=363837 RepID=A0A2P8G123_9BACT|nr:caspase family protein [Chitinophaga ginsengisoli]PSL27673.1 putative Rossmann-fold nucleotide-binding protein [Chitinophaga ginsengisoli]
MSNNGHHQEARETIQSFTNRYAPLYPNGDHVELIQLAAFPVAVTVHLLYQIWANFGTFVKNGISCKIDALAVNDCIQSNLFRQTGPDLFEMDTDVRQCLLADLRINRGTPFVKEELAAFLYQYSRQNTQGSAWRNYYDAQQWTAIMEVDEKAAAEQILSSLAQELQKKNTSRGLGIVNLIAALEKDNKQFSGLLKNALNKPDAIQTEPGTVTSKRIVLTDEVIEGRTPVRINLPPSLSNRLKKVVKGSEAHNTLGRAYGIFVGINNYADKQFNLHESVGDARKMVNTLISRQLLESENASLILDRNATRGNVVNSFLEILLAAKSEDTVLFYFSGHSSNKQTDSALFFHDLERTSEYTSSVQNGILTDFEFKEMVKTAPNNPTIVLILDTHGGSRNWLDENNPKHISIMATHLEEMCYELAGVGGMLTEAITQCLNKQPAISYIDLYQSVLNRFLAFAHDGNAWQTPLFIVHKDHWNDVFLSKTAETPNATPRSQKTYEYLQTRDTIQCLYYSKTEQGAFTFYNQIKFALHEKRVDFEQLDTWAAIDKSFSVHNRFPDMIFIALKESMYATEPKYNIEKLLTIAEAMQIPVYFILEDKSPHDPGVYKSYPLLPADEKPVMSEDDITKLIGELETITAPLTEFLQPKKEEDETWALIIGISNYSHLPGLPAGVQNARRFSEWVSGSLKTKVSQENCYTFISDAGSIDKAAIEEALVRLVRDHEMVKNRRVLYVYVCGYAINQADGFLLCLDSWSERNTSPAIDITAYILAFSYAKFSKVIAFAEYTPIDTAALRDTGIISSPFVTPPVTPDPAPTCFFKVPLEYNDNDSPTGKNSIVLDGLDGEARYNTAILGIDTNIITSESFTAYLHKRVRPNAEHPELISKNTSSEDFVIADLDPSFIPADNTHTFKQKWVVIVGSGKSRLSQPEWMMSRALARELARSGYGIITGGWPGVDAVAAEAYAGQLEEDKIIDDGYLVQVVLEDQVPAYPGGLIERVANETQSYEETLEKAYAVIMIGGIGGTYVSYMKAEAAGIPVIPIASTGGDAAKAYGLIKQHKRLHPDVLDELDTPLNNKDDAERIAKAICKLLDEGFNTYLDESALDEAVLV